MKAWILPTLAAGAVVFLMTKPGRDLQEEITDNFSDWTDHLIRANQRLQTTLSQVQTALDRCNRTLQQVGG